MKIRHRVGWQNCSGFGVTDQFKTLSNTNPNNRTDWTVKDGRNRTGIF
jgi:hypothetical protein